MRKKKEEKLIELAKEGCRQELINQIIGLFVIEIGNILEEKNIPYETINSGGSIDMYIWNPEFEDDGYFGDLTHLVHLHPDDLLWGILNIQELKQRAMEQIDRYCKYMTLQKA